MVSFSKIEGSDIMYLMANWAAILLVVTRLIVIAFAGIVAYFILFRKKKWDNYDNSEP
jgi:hypothetical protein